MISNWGGQRHGPWSRTVWRLAMPADPAVVRRPHAINDMSGVAPRCRTHNCEPLLHDLDPSQQNPKKKKNFHSPFPPLLALNGVIVFNPLWVCTDKQDVSPSISCILVRFFLFFFLWLGALDP